MTTARLVTRGTRATTQAGQTTAARTALLGKILANKRNLFTAAELRGWSESQLGKLQSMLTEDDQWESYPTGQMPSSPATLAANNTADCGCGDDEWETYSTGDLK